MPQWFLRYWIAAAALVGGYYVIITSGIMSLVGTSVGGANSFFIASQDVTNATPAVNTLGKNAIDIQTLRTASIGALAPSDIVIGSLSGLSGSISATLNGKNTLVGTGNVIASIGTSVGSNVIVGANNARSRIGSPTFIDGGSDVIVGSGNTIPNSAGSSVFLGSGLLLQAGNQLQNATNYNFAASIICTTAGSLLSFGASTGVQVADQMVFGPNCGIAIGTPITGALGNASVGVGCLLGDSAISNPSIQGCGLFGMGIALANPTASVTRYGNGTGACMALIDTISGAGVNTSLVLLGTNAAGLDLQQTAALAGANVAYANAIADMGRFVVASAASLQLPDNCSLVIVTGAVNSAIKMPVNPIDGQKLRISFDGAQAPLSWSPGAGQTLRNAPANNAAQAVGSSLEFIFNKTIANGGTANCWYRMS